MAFKKIVQVLLFMIVIGFSSSMQAQKKESKKDTIKEKKDNFLDMQANVLTDVFGSNLDGNTDGKKLNYLQLLEKSKLTAEQKAEYKNLYYLQAKDLTQLQKDSLGKVISKKIKEAKHVDE